MGAAGGPSAFCSNDTENAPDLEQLSARVKIFPKHHPVIDLHQVGFKCGPIPLPSLMLSKKVTGDDI